MLFPDHSLTVSVLWLFLVEPLIDLKCVIMVFPDHLLTVSVVWLFYVEPLVDLQCVIVVFPDHTHLHYSGVMVHVIFCINIASIHFTTRTYVVATQKNHLSETVILGSQNLCFNLC